jgi:hypothetical protein
VAKQFSAPVDSFFRRFWRKQVSGAFNKTVLPECLVNINQSKPMKDLKIKGGSFDMAGAAGVTGMLGSAIGKGDGDATTFTKKEKKGVLMSSTLKGVGTGL